MGMSWVMGAWGHGGTHDRKNRQFQFSLSTSLSHWVRGPLCPQSPATSVGNGNGNGCNGCNLQPATSRPCTAHCSLTAATSASLQRPSLYHIYSVFCIPGPRQTSGSEKIAVVGGGGGGRGRGPEQRRGFHLLWPALPGLR
eukprot:scaffold26152_cov126-Isochrysis_galbana.AAC.6